MFARSWRHASGEDSFTVTCAVVVMLGSGRREEALGGGGREKRGASLTGRSEMVKFLTLFRV